MSRKKAVVTGAAGFIGSRLAHRLLDDGWQVVGIDGFLDTYDPAEKLARAGALVHREGFVLAAGHLARLDLTAWLDGAEVVFHLAGRAGVRASFGEEPRYRFDNVVSTERLVAAARETSSVKRLVYASSSSVYGEAPLPFSEDGATKPVSPYGRSKLDAERACLEASGEGLETVALRYFTVYGPGQRPDMALRLFAEAALSGKPVRVFGDGAQSRDFTYVDDVVEATYRASTVPASGLAINVGGGSRVSLLEMFMRSPRQIFSRAQILNRVWDYGFEPGSNIVDVYVGYLRRKLNRGGAEPLIVTVRGAGYRLLPR